MHKRPHAARSAEGSRRAQEPPAQQVELGAPKHLALEHLQAVDVAFDWAIAPRQPETGFDGLVVRAEPHSKALQGCYTTGDGSCQPLIEPVGLALAHDRTKVLRQPDRPCQVTVLALEVREEL
jgi:hypothetical protein